MERFNKEKLYGWWNIEDAELGSKGIFFSMCDVFIDPQDFIEDILNNGKGDSYNDIKQLVSVKDNYFYPYEGEAATYFYKTKDASKYSIIVDNNYQLKVVCDDDIQNFRSVLKSGIAKEDIEDELEDVKSETWHIYRNDDETEWIIDTYKNVKVYIHKGDLEDCLLWCKNNDPRPETGKYKPFKDINDFLSFYENRFKPKIDYIGYPTIWLKYINSSPDDGAVSIIEYSNYESCKGVTICRNKTLDEVGFEELLDRFTFFDGTRCGRPIHVGEE